MKTIRADVGLERLLTALERELLDMSDDEILGAALELGLKPDMQGSIALFGVTRCMRPPESPRDAGAPTSKLGTLRGTGRRRPKGDFSPRT